LLNLAGNFLHARWAKNFHLWRGSGDINLDGFVIEFAGAQFHPEFFPCGVMLLLYAMWTRQKRIEYPFFSKLLGADHDCFLGFFARFLDGDFDEIANDGLDITTNIAHFREFCRLDFEKRGFNELGEPSGNFSFANTRWSDHQYILRGDFLT